MKKTIWKYALKNIDSQHLYIPEGGEILTIQTQLNNACMWVLVDPLKDKKLRRFDIFGTGHEVDMGVKKEYVGTYQLDEGSLIFHVFENLEL